MGVFDSNGSIVKTNMAFRSAINTLLEENRRHGANANGQHVSVFLTTLITNFPNFFNSEIISYLMKRCKNHTENFHIPFTQIHYFLPYCHICSHSSSYIYFIIYFSLNHLKMPPFPLILLYIFLKNKDILSQCYNSDPIQKIYHRYNSFIYSL